MPENQFKHLEVALWRQFASVSIDFHPRLTVITGANGAGKSTLLSILGRHFGWSRPYLSVPTTKNGILAYVSGLFDDAMKRFGFRAEQPNSIGYIDYTVEQDRCSLVLSGGGGWQVDLQLSNARSVYGLFIDSHRPNPHYSQVGQIPLQPMTAAQSFNNYNSEMQTRYQGGYTGNSPIFRMKESIISMAIFGEGNATLGGSNQEILNTFLGFNEVLRKLLPPSLGFQRIAIRSPEVLLVTDSGEFMLDASSGGIMTLIDVAWRIYMFSKDKAEFVVLMDEPENHLHPSMQRTLMRRLLSAFPKAQFVIATHSPFMVSSVRDSNVYVLRYQDDDDSRGVSADVALPVKRHVISEQLSLTNKASTAGDVLREVLGVPATMPEWVEEDLDGIVQRYKGRKLTAELLDSLRRELTSLGFDEYYPETLAEIARPQ
jgi:energy-coupling factor transporter ATP-binding protein EcfA2